MRFGKNQNLTVSFTQFLLLVGSNRSFLDVLDQRLQI